MLETIFALSNVSSILQDIQFLERSTISIYSRATVSIPFYAGKSLELEVSKVDSVKFLLVSVTVYFGAATKNVTHRRIDDQEVWIDFFSFNYTSSDEERARECNLTR